VPARVDALRARALEEVEQGNIPSCQFALALDGEVVVHETLGDAPADARYGIFSATKPLVASVIWQLMGEQRLDQRQPVSTWWPGFAENGKGAVTLEQVLLHTSGFPNAEIDLRSAGDRSARVDAMEHWTLEWEPGSKFEYHPMSAHWVLAELITLVTGDDHRDALRSRVLDPLGLERLELGVPIDRQDDIQRLVTAGDAPTAAEVGQALGVNMEIQLPPATFTLEEFEDPNVRCAGVPGGGGVSDAASLAGFYLALLDDRHHLWDPAILHDVTTNVRNRFQNFLGLVVMRSLGLEVAGDDGGNRYRVGAGAASPSTFGHGGAAGQISWADPMTGLVFVFLTNGVDRNFLRELRRGIDLSVLAVDCVEPGTT